MLLKALIILTENQSKSSPNFMMIRITYPNLLQGGDFLCSLHELLMKSIIFNNNNNNNKSNHNKSNHNV